jgi:hypothetical protein
MACLLHFIDRSNEICEAKHRAATPSIVWSSLSPNDGWGGITNCSGRRKGKTSLKRITAYAHTYPSIHPSIHSPIRQTYWSVTRQPTTLLLPWQPGDWPQYHLAHNVSVSLEHITSYRKNCYRTTGLRSPILPLYL